MDRAGVLNIAAAIDDDATEVAAQRCTWADVTVWADNDVTDDAGQRMDVTVRVDDWDDVVNRIAGHLIASLRRDSLNDGKPSVLLLLNECQDFLGRHRV
jgi:hypothetical protein